MKKIINYVFNIWNKFINLFKKKNISFSTIKNMNWNDISIEIEQHIYNFNHIPANLLVVNFIGTIDKKIPYQITNNPPPIKSTHYIFDKTINTFVIYEPSNFSNYDTNKQYDTIDVKDIYDFFINDLKYDIFEILNHSAQIQRQPIKNNILNILKSNNNYYTAISILYNDIIDRLLNSHTQCVNHTLGEMLNLSLIHI